LDVYKDSMNDPIKVNLQVVPDYLETAGILLSLKSVLRGDFIVMGGDLIVEGDFLHLMADNHRQRDAAVTVLAFQSKFDTEENTKQSGDEVVEYFAVDPKTNRLLMMFDSTSLHSDFIKVKKKLFRRFPNFILFPILRDAHFYMFSKWTLDILEKNSESVQSIKRDFIPFLTRCQYEKNLVEGIQIPSFLSPEVKEMTSTRNDPTDKVKCFLFKFPDQGGKKYCDRVDSIPTFFDINRKIADGGKNYQPVEPRGLTPKVVNFIASTAKIEKQTAIPSGSIIGAYTTVGDRVGVKKTIIGTHCKIGNNAKVINCVIFDHVTIQDGAKVQNSVVGANCYIERGADVTDCLLGAGTKVEAGTTMRSMKIASR